MRKQLREDILEIPREKLWDELYRWTKGAASGNDLRLLLGRFLTTKELAILENRFGVDFYLHRSLSLREIARILGTTRKTISFVKKGLKRVDRQPRHSQSTLVKARVRRQSRRSILPPRGKGRWRFLQE